MQLDSPPNNGACAGKPVSWFFPDSRTRTVTRDARSALQICKTCKVMKECGNYALKWELHGIWGGMTERERRMIRNERGIVLESHGYLDPAFIRMRK